MKAVFVSLLTLAAGAFASPVVAANAAIQRDTTTTVTKNVTITSVTENIRTYTSSINETVVEAPTNPTTEERNTIIVNIAPKIEAITDILTVATKAASSTDFWKGVPQSSLLADVLALVYEIVYTVKALIVKLGITGLLVYLQPLFLALGGLVRALDIVVDGLLVTVQGILDTVLSAVASILVGLL
ncbi:hypothetical protein SLS53_001666 [Cytospora paraplurivora]|uniref:Uncharacterized protein n=1 Tax=Cytospora paraplurivora TaxID=2898453 RepID=A0AAN9YKG9_9PEZI